MSTGRTLNTLSTPIYLHSCKMLSAAVTGKDVFTQVLYLYSTEEFLYQTTYNTYNTVNFTENTLTNTPYYNNDTKTKLKLN